MAALQKNNFIAFSFFMHTQLERCQEGDCGRVFEINLNGQALEQVPNLKEVIRI